MKKNILIIALLIIPVFANSQDTISLKDRNINKSTSKHNNRISISIGKSIAGEEVINNFNNSIDRMGYGINFNALYSYQFSKFLGFEVKGYHNTNKFRGKSYNIILGSTISSQLSNNNVKYNSYGFLAGPKLSVQLLDGFSIDGCILLGYANWIKPATTFTIISGTSNLKWIKMDKISSNSIVYNFGLGFSYAFFESWDLFTKCDFITGWFRFNENILTMNDGSIMYLQKGSQKYGEFNISVGLGFKL